jgi:cell wall-associated NlpC family hydrolase
MRSAVGFIALLGLLLGGCASRAPEKGTNQIGAYSSSRVVVDHKKRNEIVLTALGLLETRYRYGGASPSNGFDCSGLVAYVFAQAAGQPLPHNTAAIAKHSRPIEKRQLRAGDLLFFNTLNQSLSHVGIYLGDGQFINAPSSGGKVRIDKLEANYFAQRFEGAGTLFDR